MAIDAQLIPIDDDKWFNVLDRVNHDVYDTVPFVLAEAHRIGARPMAFIAQESDRLFATPLLVRPVPESACDDDEVQWFDAVSPYGYPGLLMSPSAQGTSGFSDDCIASMREVLRADGVCCAFVRAIPVLNEQLAERLHDDALVVSGTTVSIDLRQTPGELWAGMRRGHTNAINRAKRFGFRATITPAASRFDDFLVVYSETLDRIQAASNYHFSSDYIRSLMSIPASFVAVATLDGDVAGAYWFFECGEIVQMHLGGPRSAYMRPSSSHMLIHEVALWGMSRGDRILHLGGGVGGSADDSLFTFKSGFSPRRHSYCTLRVIADERAYECLVHREALARGVSAAGLLAAPHFPVYRSGLGRE